MGPFDNDSGRFVENSGYESGHWYVGEDGQLYLVPNAEAEIEGPDDDTLEELNEIYRETPFEQVVPEQVAQALNLEVVLDAFKRFSPEQGYFRT